MATTYMTNDQWAIYKGYTQFLTDSGNGFVDNNKYPTADALDLYREDAYAVIISLSRGLSSLSAARLRRIEYETVEFMFDLEQSRETEENRTIHVPAEKITLFVRNQLAASGSTGFTRGIGS